MEAQCLKSPINIERFSRFSKVFMRKNRKDASSIRRTTTSQPEELIGMPQEQGVEDEVDGDASANIVDEEEHVDPDCILPNPSLLDSFQSHVVNYIWRGSERAVIKCHSHVGKLLAWKLFDVEESPCHREWKRYFKDSGLLKIRSFSYSSVNKNLITAFIERWHPETNSFHLPCGEITITLDDVYCITGLSVEGRPVQSSRVNKSNGLEDIENILGVDLESAKEAIGSSRGSSVKLEWLRNTFMDMCASEDESEVLCSARAYALYTFGCSMFADKSGARVSTSWIEYLEDMESLHEYSWGAATLAYLYRQLGSACKYKTAQISGYLTLLEAWIYEHFSVLCKPPHNSKFITGEPLSARWSPEAHSGPAIDRVIAYRERIDALQQHEITWNPYVEIRREYPIQSVTFFHGCLVCGDVVEPYMPDRVLRQYGFIQTIPERPLVARVSRGSTTKTTQKIWGRLADYFETWDSHLLSDERLGERARVPWESSDDYLVWFAKNSHVHVSYPFVRQQASSQRAPIVENAWILNRNAQNLMSPILDSWRAGEKISMEEAMKVMDDSYRALQPPPNPPGVSSRARRGRGRASVL